MKILKSKHPEIYPGDKLISINGNKIDDILDCQFHFENSSLTIEISRNGSTKQIIAEGPLSPAPLVFDKSVAKVKNCTNHCLFCFIDQLPPGLRKSLYLKDDDYRLSLIYGNFITLTNLTKQDINKITGYRISPLYVSLHSTNAKTRLKIFGKDEKGLENFNYLSNNGIKFHVQLVIIPGINDGPDLDETLEYLSGKDSVLSVGIVPVAKTKYGKGNYPLFNKTSSSSLLDLIDDSKSKANSRIIYAADELFLLAEKAIPQKEYYGDFPQTENGIGLSRIFLDEMEGFSTDFKATVLTGSLSQQIVKKGLKDCPNLTVKAVKNSFFGNQVTVTGLLSGKDVSEAVAKTEGTVLIPEIVVNPNGYFLDGVAKNKIDALKRVNFVPSEPKGFKKAVA